MSWCVFSKSAITSFITPSSRSVKPVQKVRSAEPDEDSLDPPQPAITARREHQEHQRPLRSPRVSLRDPGLLGRWSRIRELYETSDFTCLSLARVNRQRSRLCVRVLDEMSPTRAIPPLLKHLNERTVLETIRARRAHLAGGDLEACRNLEADRLAGAAIAPRCRARARVPLGAAGPELRRRLLRIRAGGRARARPRPRRALPARRHLRPRRGGPGATGRRAPRRRRRRSADRGRRAPRLPRRDERARRRSDRQCGRRRAGSG